MANGLDTPAPGDKRIVISVDAMGGDRGPAAVVAGMVASAAKNPDIGFIVHGDEAELSRLIGKRKGRLPVVQRGFPNLYPVFPQGQGFRQRRRGLT